MKRTDLIAASILFLLLQIGDILTTHVGLSIGGSEGNPFAAIVQMLHGEVGMYLVKMVLGIWVVGIIWMFDKRYNGRLRKALWASCGIYFGIICWNAGIPYALGAL